jgi:haloacetate dehalogenase
MAGMEQRTVRANGIRINAWMGGKGPPVVLLHGYPQTGQMWRNIAPGLLDQFTVVCPDLRGYGDSDKPAAGYDKRTMARDIHLVMEGLGHKSYAVVGHDRGARVAHRLAIDYADGDQTLHARHRGHPHPFRKRARSWLRLTGIGSSSNPTFPN